MEWPYRRFIKAFNAFQRRTVCDELRQRRIMHITALYSNSNLDGEDSPRSDIIEQLEHAYEQLIADAWNGTTEAERIEASGVMDTGFMKASKRAVTGMVRPPVLPGEEVIGALP